MRLGLHVNADRALDRALDYCARVQPGVMKWLEPRRDILEACRAASPGTKHIARVVWEPQNPSSYGDFQNRTLAKARELRGVVDYWEGWNEHITPSTPEDDVKEFARQEAGLAKRLNDEGIGALIGGFSTGVLDGGRLNAFRRAFEYIQSVGPDLCALHFHEYAGAYMGLFVETRDGLNQWDHPGGRWTGWSADRQVYYDPTLTGWLTLRYRKLIPLLEREGWDQVRFVITESGIDDTNPRPGPPNAKGWRDYDNPEWNAGPMGDYADQQHWYLWQMSHDRRVIGAVDFGFGTIDPRWNSFDLAQRQDMFDRVIARQMELPVGYHSDPVPGPTPTPPPPTPIPTPPPTPEPPALVDRGLRTRVGAGEGWGAIARRVYALESAPWAQVKAHAEAVAEASGKTLADPLDAGDELSVPGWAVLTRNNEPADPSLPPAPLEEPRSLAERLRADFGNDFEDLRAALPVNPNGPTGPFAELPAENVDAIVVHHTATGQRTEWRTVASAHLRRNFAGIGYHLGVRLGRVAYVGDVTTARAHVRGQNHRLIGIAVMGNYVAADPDPRDVEQLKALIAALRTHFGREIPVIGHRDEVATACPGDRLYGLLPTLNG